MPWSDFYGDVQSKVGLEDLRGLFDLIDSMIPYSQLSIKSTYSLIYYQILHISEKSFLESINN